MQSKDKRDLLKPSLETTKETIVFFFNYKLNTLEIYRESTLAMQVMKDLFYSMNS